MLAYLGHVGYVLSLCAFLARDVLIIRSLMICAQINVAFYAFRVVHNRTIGIWNLVFLTINIIYVVRILRERRAVQLPADLKPLYERHFAAMTPPEFLRFWKIGNREVLRDARLATAGTNPEYLFFLLRGTVQVSRDHADVTELSAGYFVAEMSLLTGHPANADADAVGEVEVMRWPTAELRELRARNPVMWTKIQSAIGFDLVEKIRRSEQRPAPAPRPA